jgi:hypothetical protein
MAIASLLRWVARQKAFRFRLTASLNPPSIAQRVRLSKAPIVMLSRLAEDCNALWAVRRLKKPFPLGLKSGTLHSEARYRTRKNELQAL